MSFNAGFNFEGTDDPYKEERNPCVFNEIYRKVIVHIKVYERYCALVQ